MTVQINPYEVLGVERNADEATIRKAYRKKAAKAHPDAGGKPDEWANVSTSLMVLTDPDLRRGYDETGKIGEKAIDNDRAAALQLIDQEVAKLINAYITNGFSAYADPRKIDIPARIKASMEDEISQAKTAITTGGTVIKFYEDMRARFVVRDAAAVPEDSIGRMIVNQIDGAKKQIEALEKNIVVRELALKIVAGYDFRWDQPSYASTNTFFVGTVG